MTADQWPALLVSLGGLLAVIGTGIKWLLGRFEKRLQDSERAARDAREALDKRLSAEIHMLRNQINVMELQKNLFMKRIYQLEGFIHKMPGVSLPDMNGWPP